MRTCDAFQNQFNFRRYCQHVQRAHRIPPKTIPVAPAGRAEQPPNQEFFLNELSDEEGEEKKVKKN